MISNELIQYYEALVASRPPVEVDPNFKEYATEIRAAWEARAILRDLRNRAGIATCSGEVDCVEAPTHECTRGGHPTCLRHRDCCYLCPLKAAPTMRS